ncbi:MAG: hypothetical protein ACYTGD_03260 [Planctomycetota bacterium]|jgi:hypothetical protein
MTGALDYDLHGLARVRLLGATPRDAAAVGRQLGLEPTEIDGDPDISIRFVDELPSRGPLRLLGLDDAGFTQDAFIVLRGRYKSRARVQIPFERIGRQCEIVCEHGAARIPLLTSILNLTVLGKGGLPLHAAAFRFNGMGILATGWSKGGKTETLLAFMAHGAAYVGDEWVYLSADGGRVFGIPEPIRVWSWHLQSLPRYRHALSRRDRVRLRLLTTLVRGLRRATADGARHLSSASRTINRITPLLGKQLCVDVPPQRLFGRAACEGTGTSDRIFFTASQQAPEVSVRPINPQEVARRMVFSLQQEQQELMSYYWKFRFAFPDASNELIERSRELQHQELIRMLADKEAFDVRHPYPVELAALYDALRPYCE